MTQGSAAAVLRAAAAALVAGLNAEQRLAVQRVLGGADYSLVLGMPGTGKTSLIVAAVRAADALIARARCWTASHWHPDRVESTPDPLPPDIIYPGHDCNATLNHMSRSFMVVNCVIACAYGCNMQLRTIYISLVDRMTSVDPIFST